MSIFRTQCKCAICWTIFGETLVSTLLGNALEVGTLCGESPAWLLVGPASRLGPAGDIKVRVVHETPGTRWAKNCRFQQLGIWLDVARDANGWSNLMPHFVTICAQAWRRSEWHYIQYTKCSFVSLFSPVPFTGCLRAYRFHITSLSCSLLSRHAYIWWNRISSTLFGFCVEIVIMIMFPPSQNNTYKSSQVSFNARRRAQCKGGGGNDKNIYTKNGEKMYILQASFRKRRRSNCMEQKLRKPRHKRAPSGCISRNNFLIARASTWRICWTWLPCKCPPHPAFGREIGNVRSEICNVRSENNRYILHKIKSKYNNVCHQKHIHPPKPEPGRV